MPRIHHFEDEEYDQELIEPRRQRGALKRLAPEERRSRPSPHHHPRKVAEGLESFKCGHCRAFVGPTVAGGRHRNHCPLCLYSRHVDRSFPGDRACECRSLMQPAGLSTRRNGEQVIVHRCLGCSVERVCRVAADDNPVAVMRLPLVPHPAATPASEPVDEEELA